MFLPKDEIKLSKWIEENALVCWKEHPEPWIPEGEMIDKYSLPLNIRDNENHPFYNKLTVIRKEANKRARELDMAIE